MLTCYVAAARNQGAVAVGAVALALMSRAACCVLMYGTHLLIHTLPNCLSAHSSWSISAAGRAAAPHTAHLLVNTC